MNLDSKAIFLTTTIATLTLGIRQNVSKSTEIPALSMSQSFTAADRLLFHARRLQLTSQWGDAYRKGRRTENTPSTHAHASEDAGDVSVERVVQLNQWPANSH